MNRQTSRRLSAVAPDDASAESGRTDTGLTARELGRVLMAATAAARSAGRLMYRNLREPKRVNEATQHDIKLELDVRCQQLLERALRRTLPRAAILGEEGSTGDVESPLRWVVDPIDGTVNFAHGIPHACVCIALQQRATGTPTPTPPGPVDPDGFATVLGVVHDPFTDELWTATDRGPALLNGRPIRVSERPRLAEAIVSLGFGKRGRSLNHMLAALRQLTHRVRKLRITGSAGLAMTYVASGRFDAFVESGVRLWDIAAGGLIVQRAGGVFWRRAIDRQRSFEIVVSSAPLQRPLHRLAGSRVS